MALSWVKVVGAPSDDGRDVFVNGNFVDPAGSVGTPFRVETGQDTFALLKPDMSVERSVTVIVDLHPKKTDPQLIDIGAPAAPAVAAAPAAAGPPSGRSTP